MFIVIANSSVVEKVKILNKEKIKCFLSRILRDKTKAEKLIYNRNDVTQIQFCGL